MIASYRQVVHGDGDNHEENFRAWVRELEQSGLSEAEVIATIAEDFAQTYLGIEDYPPEEALRGYCTCQGIPENIEEALYEYLTAALTEDEDNVEVNWEKLSPQEHERKVRAFIKKLAGSEGRRNSNKTFLPVNQQVSPSRRPPDRKFDDQEPDNNNNKLQGVAEERETIDNAHRSHCLHSLLRSHGFEHHKSYLIKQPDHSLKLYHIWAGATHPHTNSLVASYRGERAWSSKVDRNSGHVVNGNGKVQLDNLLKNRAAKAGHNERLQIPTTALQEGLSRGSDKVQKYSAYLRQNCKPPHSDLGQGSNSPTTVLKETERLQSATNKKFRLGEEDTWLSGKAHSSYWGKK